MASTFEALLLAQVGYLFSNAIIPVSATQKLGVATASVTFSSIPTTYNHLLLAYAVQSAGTANAREFLLAQINGDTNSAHYFGQALEASNTTTSPTQVADAGIQIGNTVESGATGFSANQFASGLAVFPGWSNSGNYLTAFGGDYGGTTTVGNIGIYGGSYLVTGARTSLTFKLVTNNLNTGSTFSLYGMV